MRYQYTGPGPIGPVDGELLRPGDIREFDEEPDYGPWELLDGPDTPASEAEVPALAPPVSAVPPGVPVMQVAPVAPAKPEGM